MCPALRNRKENIGWKNQHSHSKTKHLEVVKEFSVILKESLRKKANRL
jgi:hypothetical protein